MFENFRNRRGPTWLVRVQSGASLTLFFPFKEQEIQRLLKRRIDDRKTSGLNEGGLVKAIKKQDSTP